jgi:hypothetical protein
MSSGIFAAEMCFVQREQHEEQLVAKGKQLQGHRILALRSDVLAIKVVRNMCARVWLVPVSV